MRSVRRLIAPTTGLALFVAGVVAGCGGEGAPSAPATRESVGAMLFNDVSLSSPEGQSCASCHVQTAAFADPRQDQPTSEGVVRGLFGNRQTPTLMYMAFSPPFGIDPVRSDFRGGQFWDGRAVDLKDQVHFPLLNPAEMNNESKRAIVYKVLKSPAAEGMRQVFGEDVYNDVDSAFEKVAECIAAFESTRTFAPFSSKYDRFLQGKAVLNLKEARGLELFNTKAGCASCHPSAPGPGGEPPLFTDFGYHNLGVPKNPANPFYSMPPHINPEGAGFIDVGLMATTKRPVDRGRMKTPTLRNISKTAPYFHNGVFGDLDTVMRFYNARDLGGFDPPEVPENVNRGQLGDLKLTRGEIADILTFLNTLNDGWRE